MSDSLTDAEFIDSIVAQSARLLAVVRAETENAPQCQPWCGSTNPLEHGAAESWTIPAKFWDLDGLPGDPEWETKHMCSLLCAEWRRPAKPFPTCDECKKRVTHVIHKSLCGKREGFDSVR